MGDIKVCSESWMWEMLEYEPFRLRAEPSVACNRGPKSLSSAVGHTYCQIRACAFYIEA